MVKTKNRFQLWCLKKIDTWYYTLFYVECNFMTLRFYEDRIKNEYIQWTAQFTVDILQIKSKRADWDGLEIYRGRRVNISVEGCWGWNCQKEGLVVNQRFTVKEVIRLVGVWDEDAVEIEADDSLWWPLKETAKRKLDHSALFTRPKQNVFQIYYTKLPLTTFVTFVHWITKAVE